ncbi:MAG: nucleotidyl transferase AbiEii/AbiGii toxin family protein [Candidatus Diapherotrites archaeon]|nr:nucleotidyl transferase AbiEii/AbiGii toxin family protein [Candidatus Diapherotrites archaeon]
MIDKEKLLELAKLNNMKPWQQEKHYIQNAVLVSLAEYPLVFKGGTYLWFFHHLLRFSEDLDFTASQKLPGKIMENTLNTLENFQIKAKGKRMEGSVQGTSFRIASEGPLYKGKQSTSFVYVEISLRENILRETIPLSLKNENYGFQTKLLNGMALEEVSAEKVRAIMTRDKPRDVFDLAFLIREKKISFDLKLINQKMKYYNERFDQRLFLKKLQEKKQGWKRELGYIAFGKLPDFKSEMKVIQEWIQEET